MIFGKFSFHTPSREQSPNARAFADEHLSLTTIYPEKLSFANQIHEIDGRFILHVFGELILANGTTLRNELSAREFIDGITRNESEYLSACKGVFCIVLYDKLLKTLKLITDVFGNLAMHYHYSEKTVSLTMQCRIGAHARL